MSVELEYRFHVHKTVPLWRLVISARKGFPAETTEAQWRFTRARTAEDTNVEVREMIEADGYCLFKVGGTFAQVERDRAES
ncbi:MAG: hypothetical protein AAFY82_02020 [Pseudomonadota bacterium]